MSTRVHIRKQIRAALLDAGTPAQFVDEIVDLACHASEQAQQTIFDVARRASDQRVAMAMLGPAAGLAEQRMKAMLEGLEEFSVASGMPAHRAIIGGEPS